MSPIAKAQRWFVQLEARWKLWKQLPDAINRRVAVEQKLFNAGKGKRPLPDAEECRQMAQQLGTPRSLVASVNSGMPTNEQDSRPKGVSFAPWSQGQVERLKARQQDSQTHGYTCPHCATLLTPTSQKFQCDNGCDYAQYWCHNSDL